MRNADAGLAAEVWVHNISIDQAGQARDGCTCSPVEIPPTMEIVVTGIANNKLHCAAGSSALLTPSAISWHTAWDTSVAVGASLVSSDLTPVILLNPTDQSMSLRKGGTVGVLQSVPRVEVFNVSAGDLWRVCWIRTRVFRIYIWTALDKWSSQLSVELNSSQRDAVRATLRSYSDVFVEISSQFGTTGLTKHKVDTGDAYPIRQRPRLLPVAQQEMFGPCWIRTA